MVEGTVRSTNTSPTSKEEEQTEEAIVSEVNSQAGTTQADTQEETLQPESSKIEDTGIKKVKTQEDQIQVPQKSRIQGIQMKQQY